jgi:hypothetical protein
MHQGMHPDGLPALRLELVNLVILLSADCREAQRGQQASKNLLHEKAVLMW